MEGCQNMPASKSRHFMFLTILAAMLNSAKPQDYSDKLDLAFVIDGSGSICSNNPCTNWKLMLRFINQIVEGLPIGPNDTRVALLTFSSTTTINWNFTRFTEKSCLFCAIDNLYYPRGRTVLVPALQTLTSSIFPASSDRPGASKMAIIITDGQPNENITTVKQAASYVHSRGIKILAVGVTRNIREATLKILSSEPKEENVTYFKANDFSSVFSIYSQLQYRIFQIKKTTVLKTNISKGPQNVAALVGSEVKLECVNNGSNALPSWLLSKNPTDANKIVIVESCRVQPEYASRYYVITGASGSGVCNLLIRNATLNDTGVYTCNDRNLVSFSSIVSIFEVQKSVTKDDEVVSGDTITFHYSVKLNETQHLPVTVQASSFSNRKCLRYKDQDIVTTVYSYEILTKPEGVPTFEFMMNFSAPVNNPPNFASNAPSYCYQSISTGYTISFKPEEKNMTIRGDTNGFMFDGGILECHVSSYPPPVYTWQDQIFGNITNGETVKVTRSGKYTCNASNVIRNKTEWCLKSIGVQVVSTETIAFLEKRYAVMFWSLMLLAVIVFGFVTVLMIYLVHRHHQNSDSLLKGKKNCPSNIDQPNVEQQALNDCDLPNASPQVDSNQQKEPSGTMDIGSVGEVYSLVDKSAQKHHWD